MLSIEVTGIKGGVGKSTMAALLSLSLLRMGGDVLLMDLDPLGWSSYLLGIRGEGVLTSTHLDDSKEHWSDITFEDRRLRVIKMLGNGQKLDLALEDYLRNEAGIDQLKRVIASALKDSFQFIIIDSSLSSKNGTKTLEYLIRTIAKPSLHMRRLYVTDLNRISIETLLNNIVKEDVENLGVIINMVPPIPSHVEMAESYATMFKGVVSVIPFIENLFNIETLSPSSIPPQVMDLAGIVHKPVPDFLLIV
ncbi:AAA family ATPase [Metallosphaera hakonensis]|nr:AAA family ATPase [Metallosphaera hakonensis]